MDPPENWPRGSVLKASEGWLNWTWANESALSPACRLPVPEVVNLTARSPLASEVTVPNQPASHGLTFVDALEILPPLTLEEARACLRRRWQPRPLQWQQGGFVLFPWRRQQRIEHDADL